MQNLSILNKKETKNLLTTINEQFGANIKLEYVFLISNKNKVYIVNKDVFEIPIERLRINSIGLYFAEIRDNELRLSMDGSQIIGPVAKNNVLELNEAKAREWLKGYDVDINCKENGFLIIKHKSDFLGCGKPVKNKVLNYVPKTRRLRVSD
jgi:NOL1/NOP2/fmu family ribosome biogenesis protein